MNRYAQRYGLTRLVRLVVLGAAVLLSACSLFPQKDVRLASLKDGVTVVSYPAEMRGAYIIPRQGQDTICSEPAPDVALKSVAELSSKLTANVQGETKLDAEAAAKVTTEAIQLAGRTQLVLVARDMLYSLCSVSRNNDFTPEQVKDIYSEIANVITVLANADQKNAQARYQEAQNRAKAFVEVESSKVDKIVAFLSDSSGKLIKGTDGKYTKLEELFTKVDQGAGPKLNDWTKNRLRRATNATEMKRVLLDVTQSAINPLFDALPQ
jgi:hypothetical protein